MVKHVILWKLKDMPETERAERLKNIKGGLDPGDRTERDAGNDRNHPDPYIVDLQGQGGDGNSELAVCGEYTRKFRSLFVYIIKASHQRRIGEQRENII